MHDLSVFADIFFLKEYMVTLFDKNSMGVCIKIFNDGKDKDVELLYDKETYHFDFISPSQIIFMVRHYFYVCHKGCSRVKHRCTGSCCLLCCHPSCKNRVGYITSSDVPGRRRSFKCETGGLILRSQDCLHNHIGTRLRSLSAKCSLCSVTISRHSSANNRRSKKRRSIFSQYFKHASEEVLEYFVQRLKSHVRNISCEIIREIQDESPTNERRTPLLPTFVFTFSTLRQSRNVTIRMIRSLFFW